MTVLLNGGNIAGMSLLKRFHFHLADQGSLKPLLMWIWAFMPLATTAAHGQAQELALHDGDRVVFYGDSITAQRLYTRFFEDFMLTRYPQMHVSFWNAGVPGDTVYGGYTGDLPARLKRDVLPRRPTVVSIMLGMNDGYYMAYNPKYFDIYKEGYRKLLDALQAGMPEARITLISPTPYDEVTHGTEFAQYNDVVSHHAAFVKEWATSSHLAFSDFNLIETNLLNAGARDNRSLAALLVPDRIHPAEASHWAMAEALARTWGLSSLVSNVRLEAATTKTIAAENTQVVDLKSVNGTLQWTQTDNALPLPLSLDDARIQFVLKISDLSSMDRQMLFVSGLPAPRYALQIDGKKIASLTREQLASGVNLALLATPMESQAKGVDSIELKRTRLDEALFLLIAEDPKAPNQIELTRAIERRDAALEEDQRKAAQPKPHRFELLPE
jgi:lysophospholipase L1-like esterase